MADTEGGSDVTGFRHLGDREVHQGYVWNVVVADFEAPDGATFRRDIVRSPGAVAVVPLVMADGVPSVVLVRQYRPPFDRPLIEIPAGMRDVPGEPPEETGRRELVEEVGLAADRMTHLVDMITSPGMTDSVCSVFAATGCTAAEMSRHGPEEEAMEVVQVTLARALEMIERGEIGDAKTVCGLLATARLIERGELGGDI